MPTESLMAETGVNPKLPTWDGDWRTFADYKLACQLEFDGLKEEDQVTLAPRLTRNLTGKAWEACVEVDREKLRKSGGLEYLLEFLKQKRGKQQVDILGEAFEKYFASPDVIRQDKEVLNDFEQRLNVYLRDIQRALTELGTSDKVPTEIFGWFLLNKHLRLDASDIAMLKAQTASYRLHDVMGALRKMWGGDSLAVKDNDRKKAGKAYMSIAEEPDLEEPYEPGVWWNEDDEKQEDPEPDHEDIETWFEESLAAVQDQPEDEAILANFQEAKRAFYKDARRALEQNRVNREFYPSGSSKGKGKDKGGDRGKGYAKPGEFRGRCMRCGKYGHKAQACPQGRAKGGNKGAGVGFVFTNWSPTTWTPPPETNDPEPIYLQLKDSLSKAILDCGASESIVGAWTLQQLDGELTRLGFNPDDEITLDPIILCSETMRRARPWDKHMSPRPFTGWSRLSGCMWWKDRPRCCCRASGCRTRRP